MQGYAGVMMGMRCVRSRGFSRGSLQRGGGEGRKEEERRRAWEAWQGQTAAGAAAALERTTKSSGGREQIERARAPDGHGERGVALDGSQHDGRGPAPLAVHLRYRAGRRQTAQGMCEPGGLSVQHACSIGRVKPLARHAGAQHRPSTGGRGLALKKRETSTEGTPLGYSLQM